MICIFSILKGILDQNGEYYKIPNKHNTIKIENQLSFDFFPNIITLYIRAYLFLNWRASPIWGFKNNLVTSLTVSRRKWLINHKRNKKKSIQPLNNIKYKNKNKQSNRATMVTQINAWKNLFPSWSLQTTGQQ